MRFDSEINSIPLTDLSSAIFDIAGVEVNVLRLDLIHPVTGGNKFFKLKYNLEEAKKSNCKSILSFGGAYSNHIAALASAGKKCGIKTIGIIRGESAISNITLNRAAADGMELHFVLREKYREYRNENSWNELYEKFPGCYIVPEGGSNIAGVRGCMEIAKLIPASTDHVFLAAGTGATLAGVISGGIHKIRVTGIAVVNDHSLENRIKNYYYELTGGILPKNSFDLNYDYTFGGYAKTTRELDQFVHENHINQENPSLKIETVYTGKLFFAVYDLVKKGCFAGGTSITLIHTGGLQYLAES